MVSKIEVRGRARAQPQERRRRHPAQQDRWRGGRIGLREIVARARSSLYGGLEALSGGALDLHEKKAHAGAEGGRGRGAARPCGARASSEAGRSRHPKHLRDRHGASQHDPSDVFKARFAPVSPRAHA